MSQHLHIAGVTMTELIDIVTDVEERWTVHPAPAPAGTTPMFVAVQFEAPRTRGQSAAVESWGRVDQTARLACFGESAAQAEWLRNAVLSNGWPRGWHPEPMPAIVQDDTAAPVWWVATLIMLHEP